MAAEKRMLIMSDMDSSDEDTLQQKEEVREDGGSSRVLSLYCKTYIAIELM